MIPRFLDRPLFIWPALVGVLALLGWVGYNDPVVAELRGIKPAAIDWCAKANLRQCTVVEKGEWIVVTTPDGTKHMIFVQNGKVVQVQ